MVLKAKASGFVSKRKKINHPPLNLKLAKRLPLKAYVIRNISENWWKVVSANFLGIYLKSTTNHCSRVPIPCPPSKKK